MSSTTPATTKIWQYSRTANGLENHLELKTAPVPTPKPNQHLIRVIAVSLNPVDYKIAETPIVGLLAARKPATPGIDIAGEIVVPAAGSPFKQGQLVFGIPDGPLPAAGGLAEYILATKDSVVPIPPGVSPVDAATLPVAAVTVCQSMAPFVTSGSRVFFNGGSGGVGVLAIQVAKILGCHITVTCSARNVQLCKELGADEVVDYTKGNVVDSLNALGYKFDLIIDGVGSNHSLYWKCDQYTNPGAKYMCIAVSPGLRDARFLLLASILPTFLGGQNRKLVPLFSVLKADNMRKVVEWMAEGRIQACIDSRFPMDQVPDAFRKLKTSRARGKIVIDISPSTMTSTNM